LAHRIPLYIPPFIISPESADQYNKLDADKLDALREYDFQKHAELVATQQSLKFWRPWMTHSFVENSPQVVFHFQLTADFATIAEFGREMLKELER
jgi:hypothetical protein